MKAHYFELKSNRVVMAILLVLSCILVNVSLAQPQYFNNTYVGGSNAIPFTPNSSTTFQRAQFVWGPGSFSGATPGAINKVYFYAASASTSTFSNFVVKLGTATTNPLSSANWYTTGMTTALSSSSYTITTSTSAWASITLTTPVAYDPTKFLIIDISSSGTTAGGFTINQQTLTMVPGRVYGSSTASNPSGGDNLTPDFGFDLLKSANDVSITALASPTSSCGAASDPFIVRIANMGSNAIAANQNIKVGAFLTGVINTTFVKTFNRAIAIGASDTVHLGTLLNTDAMNGNLGIKAFCRFSLDTAFRNDTLRNNFLISGTPGPPNPKDVTRCGGGSARCTAGVPSNTTGVWYSSSTSTSALAIDSVYNTPYLYPGTTTFYVESGRLSGTKVLATGIGNTGTTFGVGNPGGNMFNIVANRSLKVDSFALNINSTNKITVNVYARTGTYSGYQGTPSAWTLIKTTTVTGKGIGKETIVKMDGYTIPIGTYGIYVQASEGIAWNPGAGSFSNADLSIVTGDAVINSFSTVTSNVTWAGNVYYRTVCTGTRKPVNVTVKPSPSGAAFIKGSPFQTTQPSTIGSSGNPDIVANGDVLTYEITPPIGHSNTSYGTTWLMNNLSFRTKSGRILSGSYYSPTSPAPSGSSNAKVTFKPDAGIVDSTIIMTLSILDLGPYFCDSLLTRTIFVAPLPQTDYKFTQTVCDGDNVIFTNLSKISSGNMNFKWDFATGNPADTSINTDVVFRFPSFGTFNVKLTATSIPYGYSITKIYPVDVTEKPNIGFKVFNACLGDSVSFVNSTTISKGTISFKWDMGNGVSSTKVNPKQKYTAAGSYKVTLTATSNGCSETLTKNAWEFARPVAKFTTPSNLCDKTDILFTNGSTITTGSMGYRWTFSDGGTSTLTNAVHAFNSAGPVSVKMKAISEFGCVDSMTKMINLAEAPEADFKFGPVCNLNPTQFTFTGTKPGGGVTSAFYWKFGNEGISNLENPARLLSNIGKIPVSLTMTSSNGCTSEITREIQVKLQSKASFEANDVCDGDIAVFTNKSTVSSGNLGFLWKFGDGNFSTAQSPRHLYAPGISKTYNVTLVALVPGGCSDSMTRAVSVNTTPSSGFTYKTSGRLVYFKSSQPGNTAYHWDFGDGAASGAADTQYHYLNSFEYGKFTVCLSVTNAAGCFSQTCRELVITGGISQLGTNPGFSVYPNPNQGTFTIHIDNPKDDLTMSVYNPTGQCIRVLKGHPFSNSYPMAIQEAAGIYLVRVTNDGKTTTSRLTITN